LFYGNQLEKTKYSDLCATTENNTLLFAVGLHSYPSAGSESATVKRITYPGVLLIGGESISPSP
jgi:hypothetical protein